MTSEQLFFCCYNRSAIFFWAGGGVLKLGLNVFHHNNNFNLINIYSAKTLMSCFANFFFTCVACATFFMPFWGPAIFFLQILPLPPPPPLPLPPPQKINWSVPYYYYYYFKMFLPVNVVAKSHVPECQARS